MRAKTFKKITGLAMAALISWAGIAAAQTSSNPLPYISEGFSGASTPTGWVYDGFYRQSSGGVGGSECLYDYFTSSKLGGIVTTPYFATGASPTLSFKYKVTYSGVGSVETTADAGEVKYTIQVMTSTSSSWSAVQTDRPNVSSAGFTTVNYNFGDSYANRIISVRIIFQKVYVDGLYYVRLDDFVMGSGFRVTFDANGGTVTPGFGTTAVGGGTVASLPTPTRAGYTFAGWFTEETGGTAVTASRTYSANTTIYARWTPANYTLTYNLAGGTVPPPGNPAGYTIETEEFTLENPERAGYTFTGWTGANGTTPQMSVTVGQGSTGNKTYTANWTAIPYTVTFDANGGTVTPEEGTTGEGGKLASLPVPVMDDYFFEGWFTEETGGEEVTLNHEFSEDATIYARWTPVYLVTFDANGGTVAPEEGTTGKGGKLNSLPKPAMVGYNFDGWFTEETGGDEVTANTVFDAPATVYARWTLATYTITYYLAGGTVPPPGNPANYTIETEEFTLENPERTGYTFKGWTGANGTTPQVSVTVEQGSAGNKTYTAIWAAISYTITFDANGGTVTPDSGITDDNRKLASLPVPIMEGYNFDGWFTEETGGDKITVNTVFNGPATVYARWTKVVSVLSYERIIPGVRPDEAAAVTPVGIAFGEFTAGPNPVKSAGQITFYYQGKIVEGGVLTVYDGMGNAVRKLSGGIWDLKDSKGRLMPAGTYLVKGKIKTISGKKENVSLTVGVR